ncbi:MAG: M48 family metalloprotease [Sedimentisphaerales bacterium]|nr:M48 family metalloprotease [Sedimentisphaerales bacterium]
MILLKDILSHEIVQRLGWTLLHFIWQAVAVALILAILLGILRKSTANLRYIFACLALGLIVLLPVITIQLVPVSKPLTMAQSESAPVPTALPVIEMPEPENIVKVKPYQSEIVTEIPSIPFKQRVIDTLEPALPYIVSGWLIGVFGLSIWHLGGWTQLQRLKRRMVKQVDSSLQNKLKVLARKLKVKQTVRLMESALVQIPTVVGWLKPVILLPASAITGLNTEQLEAIIAHELAHIKRLDYLFNILQTIVEILGFYHPAVWWISYKIRSERENCCDDMAVSISGDRVSYAGALASMEEIRAAHGKLAVAAGGGNLFKRICRLLGKDSTDNTGLSWIPAITVILLIIVLAIPTTLALTTKTDSLIDEPEATLRIEDDSPNPSADSQENAKVQIAIEKLQSAYKLKRFGLAVAMYAKTHNDNMPESIQELKPWIRGQQNLNWLRDNIEYFDNKKGKTAQRNTAFIPIAYDRTLLEKADGTNVLFLDFSVRFVETEEFEKLDLKRAEFLIEARFILVGEDFLKNIDIDADSRDEVQKQIASILEELKSLDSSKPLNLILNESDVNLLLSVIDSKIIANPHILTREGTTAKIVTAQEVPILTGYTEPNKPHEKPRPKFDYAETGITMALKPNLTTNNNIYMQLELESTQPIDFEELEFEGKKTYMPRKVETVTQATQYTAKNGQTLLFGGHKIADKQDGRIVEKDLLVLITAQLIGSSEQDMPAQAKNLEVTEPKIMQTTTEKSEDFKQKQTELATERRRRPAAKDVSKTTQAITEIFEIRNGEPVEIVELLKKLIDGPAGAVIEKGKEPIVLIPEPKRKWIIAKASDENIKQIGQWIEKLDTDKTTMGLDPINKAVHEQLEKIVDLPDLNPSMPFEEVIEILENSVTPPVQIQPIWKDLLDNAEVEPATQAGMDLLTGIKLRKALEVLLIGVSSAELPKLTYVVDDGVILIGTERMLTPKMLKSQKPQAKEELESHETSERTESAKKLSELGKALLIYARDHKDKYPNSLFKLSNYVKPADIGWIMSNVEYPASGISLADKTDTVIAYDKKLLAKGKGTIVLYNNRSVSFVKAEELKKLGISESEIMIETRILSVSEDFLKDVGLNGNIENFSDAWIGHLAAKYSIDPNHETYGLIIDDLHVNFLLKNVQADQDSKVLAAPQVLCREGTTAEISVMTDEQHLTIGYHEPNSPSEKPKPKVVKVDTGTNMWLTPKLTANNKMVDLDFKLEMRKLKGIIVGKYRGKYPTEKPIVDVISMTMPCTIPEGKSMLMGGLKINDNTKKQNMLLIFIKPIINPPPKTTRILSEQEDSQEHIRTLAEKLDKKINRPAD